MPEQTYTPPETKYEVYIDELMKAIRGEPFEQGNGLRRMRGNSIEMNQLLKDAALPLNKERVYVVLSDAHLISTDAIVWRNISRNDYGIIIYKSILPRIEMSNAKIADLFLWNSQTGDININNQSGIRDIRIGNNSKLSNISIDNKSTLGGISIDNNSTSGDINIDNNSTSGDISIANNSKSGNIRIVRNSYSGDIKISKNSQSGKISLDDNSQSGKISLNDKSQSSSIVFHNNSQSGYILLGDNSQSGDISIHNNSQSDYIRLGDNSQSGFINISNNSQSGDITISNNSQSGDIWIGRNKTAMAIVIGTNSQTGNLYFANALLSQVSIRGNHFGLSLYNTAFLLFTITDCLVSTLEWQAGTKGELYINQSRVLQLQVANTSLLKDSLLSLSDTQLQYGVLQEVLIQGNLLLRKVGPPKVPFAWRDIATYKGEAPTDEWQKGLWNNKKALLEQQKQKFDNKVVELAKLYGPNPIFRITHSSLGKTEITGCDFSGFQFQYYNSNLLGCFITGTQLPKEKIDIYNPVAPGTPVSDQEWYEQKTSIYNQFKKIFENQGDVVEASWYHAKAMQNQQSLLQIAYKEASGSKIKKAFGEKGFDLFGFWLNRFSNNHGESWRRAIRFVLLFSLIFYIIYYWSIHYKDEFVLSWDALGYFWGDYFSFLDITHRIDFHVDKERLNFFSKLFDYSGKLVIGYGLYQLIAAFRRHGKKGG